MNGIGIKNLQQSLNDFVRLVRDYATIDAGATNVSIPTANKFWVVNQHVGYYVQVYSGGAGTTFEWSVVTANTTDTLTIFPALSFAPLPGDTIVILDIESPSVIPGVLSDIIKWGGTALTGADITTYFAHLNLDITSLRDAICAAGVGAKTLADIVTAITGGTMIDNITKWGGTALTGGDITLKLNNLDLALTALRDAIIGGSSKSFTSIDSDIVGASAGEAVTIANNIDISGAGVTGTLGNYKNWSLYLYAAAAINITVELSPDAGANYYAINESPIAFAASGYKVYEMGYTTNKIRLIGSNATHVLAQTRGKF